MAEFTNAGKANIWENQFVLIRKIYITGQEADQSGSK